MFAISWGIDRSQLNHLFNPKTKSLGNSQVLPKDYFVKQRIEVVIKEITEQVAARLRNQHYQTSEVSMTIGFSYKKIKKNGHHGFNHSIKIKSTNDTTILIKNSIKLFNHYWKGEAVRNITVYFSRLTKVNNIQLNLFQTSKQLHKQYKINQTSDKIRKDFGNAAIYKAYSLLEGSTFKQRANLIGGHNGGNSFI